MHRCTVYTWNYVLICTHAGEVRSMLRAQVNKSERAIISILKNLAELRGLRQPQQFRGDSEYTTGHDYDPDSTKSVYEWGECS